MRRPSQAPEHLYKYRSLSGDGLKHVEASLLRGEFYFSAAMSFNDPFDCLPVLSVAASVDQTIAQFHDWLSTDPDRDRKMENILQALTTHPGVWSRRRDEMFLSILTQFTRQVGVFSLSAIPTNTLMWSHYGDCHRGVCLRFVCTTWHAFKSVQQVIYSNNRPVLNLIKDGGRAGLTKGLLTKSRDWAYEEEWRIVTPDRGKPGSGPGVHTFPLQWLDGIILGARISPKDERSVLEMVAARNASTEVLRARIDEKKYRLTIEQGTCASRQSDALKIVPVNSSGDTS